MLATLPDSGLSRGEEIVLEYGEKYSIVPTPEGATPRASAQHAPGGGLSEENEGEWEEEAAPKKALHPAQPPLGDDDVVITEEVTPAAPRFCPAATEARALRSEIWPRLRRLDAIMRQLSSAGAATMAAAAG